MSTEYFRNLINLLESIEKVGELPHQVDEAFGIPDLPEYIPGSKANKQRKQDLEKSRFQAEQDEQYLKQEWEDIKRNSQSSPVWIYFYSGRPEEQPMKQRIKDAARNGNFKYYFFQQLSEIGAAPDPERSNERIIRYTIAPTEEVHRRKGTESVIIYKGKQVFGPSGDLTILSTAHVSRREQNRMSAEEIDDYVTSQDPYIANSAKNIVNIVNSWCAPLGWNGITSSPPTGSNVIPFKRS